MKGAYSVKDIFPTLLGNDRLRRVLSGNLSHAYIIEGAYGSGRLTAARNAAAAVLCENKGSKQHSLPCMECSVCSRIFRGIHPDVMEFSSESKKSIGVDTARTIRSQVFISPVESDFKFFVIRDADLMTPEAQNALLISIEEPPEFSIFFLLVTDRTLLLETIRSRCVTLTTEKLSDETVVSALKNLPEAARMQSTDPDGFKSIIRSADGSIGEAMKLLLDKSDEVSDVHSSAAELIRVILTGEPSEKVSFASDFPKTRDAQDKIFTAAEYALRDIIAKKMRTDADPLFYKGSEEIPYLSVPLSRLISIHTSLEDGRAALSGNVSSALTAEHIIMQKL